MTLTMAFIRRLPEREAREELVFASDSRLTGGQCFDQAQKLFGLPRSDAVLGFAGDTTYGYPLALQLNASIALYNRSVARRLPLVRALRHAARVFEQSYRLIHTLPVGEVLPIEGQAEFLFGGYCWQESRFQIWRVALDRSRRTFVVHRHRRHALIGTPEAVKLAQERLRRLAHKRGRTIETMDMEPFEVLRDFISEQTFHDVGGAPQIAKVDQNLSTAFYVTLWPDGNGKQLAHAFGRPLLPTETTTWPVFDPMSLRFLPPSRSPKPINADEVVRSSTEPTDVDQPLTPTAVSS